MPQKLKIVWYSPDETYRIKYHDLIWIKAQGTSPVSVPSIGLAEGAYKYWNKDKNRYVPFENLPWLTWLGFAVCPPGTKEGDMYVE